MAWNMAEGEAEGKASEPYYIVPMAVHVIDRASAHLLHTVQPINICEY